MITCVEVSNSALEMASSIASSATRRATLSVSATLRSKHKHSSHLLVIWNIILETWRKQKQLTTYIYVRYLWTIFSVLQFNYGSTPSFLGLFKQSHGHQGISNSSFLSAGTHLVSAVKWQSRGKGGQTGTEFTEQGICFWYWSESKTKHQNQNHCSPQKKQPINFNTSQLMLPQKEVCFI